MTEIATLVRTTTKLNVIKKDPADNRILECALAARVNFIISGDEYLLSIRKLGRTKIINASEFLKSRTIRNS